MIRAGVLALLFACASDPSPPHDDALDASVPGDASVPLDAVDVPQVDAAVSSERFAALSAALGPEMTACHASAASVAVWLDEAIVWVGGFGSFPDGRVPGEDTVFMIGSDTKKLTAISLLRRVQAGLATLETRLDEVLPDLHVTFAPELGATTIRQLLSHQSGLVDMSESTTTTTDEALERFVYGELASTFYAMAPPGRFYNYCNPGYSLAGLVDQRLDGRMWPDILTEDVFRPLGMERTFARKSEVDADHAPGFGIGGGATVESEPRPVPLEELWESAFVRPAGLVWSTPSDQMRIARFLVDGDPAVLAPIVHAELQRGHVPTYPDLPSDYGLGIEIAPGLTAGERYYAIPVWVHGGDTLTHSSAFYVLPEQRFAISILGNAGSCDFTGTVLAAIESLVALPPPSTPPPAPFETTGLDALTGTYVDEYNVGDIIVTRVADHLEMEMPLLDQLSIPYERALQPLSTRVWLGTLQGALNDFAFIDGPGGETYFRNRGFVARRGGTRSVRRALPRLSAMSTRQRRVLSKSLQ